jgi:hypothetical protein
MPPLPDDCQLWTPADIAELFGMTDRAVRYHCRRLLGPRSRYRLTPDEALRVYRFIRKFGLKSKTFSGSFPTA